MAVNWYWKHKVGEVIYRDLDHKQTWKLEMFGGNMMCAFICRFKKVNEETGKKEGYYNFFTFLNDKKHAKRCFADTRLEDLPFGNHKVIKVRLCITSKEYTYSNEEMVWLAKLFAKMGYRVEVY